MGEYHPLLAKEDVPFLFTLKIPITPLPEYTLSPSPLDPSAQPDSDSPFHFTLATEGKLSYLAGKLEA